MNKLVLTALGVMAISACNTNPFLTEWTGADAFPPFDKIKTSDFVPAVKAGIEQQEAEVNAIVTNEAAPTFENTIAAYELSGEILAKTLGVLYNVSESDATPEMQAVMDEVTPLLTASSDNIFMNKAFFERVKAVYADSSSLDREQYMVPRNFITISSITESRFLMRSRQDSRKSMPNSLPFHRSSETTFWLRTMLSRQRLEFLFPAILCSCPHVQTVQT